MRTKTVVLVAIPMAAALTVVVAFPSASTPRAPGLSAALSRDVRPEQVRPATDEERQLQTRLATSDADIDSMLELAALQERRGAIADAEATLLKLAELDPSPVAALHALAGLYNRSGHFDHAVETLERAAALDPSNPAAHHLVATYYFEKSRDPRVRAPDKQAYLEQGLAAEDRALAANPDFREALVYKNVLLRELAAAEADPVRRQALISGADALRARAGQLERDPSTAPAATVVFNPSSPPPPPPPPVPGAGDIRWVYAETSYTATGNAKTLKTVKYVRPVYPPMAITLGVQGTVVVEAAVDDRGRVISARVVESVPLLNQSTIDAVKQWQFDPATVVTAAGDRILITVRADFIPPP